MDEEALYELTSAVAKGRFAQAFGRGAAAEGLSHEDLSHDLFVAMLGQIRKAGIDIENIPAYTHAVARNMAARHVQALARGRRNLPLDLPGGSSEAAGLQASDAAAGALERKERRRLLRQGLALLAPLDLRILRLFYLEGKTRRETEEALGLSYDQLRNYKTLAISRLRRHVEQLAQPRGRQFARREALADLVGEPVAQPGSETGRRRAA